MSRTPFYSLLTLALVCACGGPAASAKRVSYSDHSLQTKRMTIVHIHAAGRQWTVHLNDSAAAGDFAAMLPLKLTMTDYAATEKIADLPGKLSHDGSPASATPHAGDIAYYAPWGNLAIYHRNFKASPGLIILGHLDGDAAPFAQAGPMPVTIERAEALATGHAK